MASAVEPVQQQQLGSHAIGSTRDDDVEWTDECNELLGQVLETQSEIASLLKDHGDTKQSLEVMKKQCDEELVELQDDAWKLQMYVELQRLGQQLERLASQDDSTLSTKKPDCADKPQDSAGITPTTSNDNHQAELDELDSEIADLDKQLVAARAELQGLLHDKVALEGEVVLAGQQLEALAVQEASQ